MEKPDRILGKAEVKGSIPFGSTIFELGMVQFGFRLS